MATQNIIAEEDRLNVLSTADPNEVDEVERLLNPTVKDPDDEDDDKAKEGDEGHEDEHDEEQRGRVDEELEQANTDAEREAIRERRRQERRDKRTRQRDKVQDLERRLQSAEASRQELARRLLALENTNTGTQYASLKQAEQQADDAIAQLERAHAEAVSKQDGNTATEAIKRLDMARDYKRQIVAAKTQMEQQTNKPQQSSVDPTQAAYVREFVGKHKWYKGPASTDLDSQMLTTIDNAMLREGWDPKQAVYWQELEKRMGSYLPHRSAITTRKIPADGAGERYTPADGGSGRGNGQRSPVAGSGSGSGQPGGKRTYRLSEDRVKAMKEAGFWDDEAKRAKMIKRYQDDDAKRARENAS